MFYTALFALVFFGMPTYHSKVSHLLVHVEIIPDYISHSDLSLQNDQFAWDKITVFDLLIIGARSRQIIFALCLNIMFSVFLI